MQASPFYDTAGSAKHVVEEQVQDAAAIASKRAAAVYGGKILKAGIEDDKRNFTRFFLVRKGKPGVLRGANKTSIAFSVKNQPGALLRGRLLSVFALRDLSFKQNRVAAPSRAPLGIHLLCRFFAGRRCGGQNALRHL